MSTMPEYVLKTLEMVDPKTYNKGFWGHFVQIAGKPKTLEKRRIWPSERARFDIGRIYTIWEDGDLTRVVPDVKIKTIPANLAEMSEDDVIEAIKPR